MDQGYILPIIIIIVSSGQQLTGVVGRPMAVMEVVR